MATAESTSATACTHAPKPGCDAATATAKFPKLAPLIAYLGSLKGRADLSVLSNLLAGLNLTLDDLKPALCFGSCSYKRNTIAESPHFELLALCWRSGHCTPIHNHVGSSCAFRVVHGAPTEIRFKMTPSGLACPIQTTQMEAGFVCSAEDDDIHQVANLEPPGTDAVTLHIYSPPPAHWKTFNGPVSDGPDRT
jgi:cysteine dioxygenase